ncbi:MULTISPECIES: hypothetical protein [Thermodesulfovibrio]|jgi:hypothetical protein|uniref:hypothetical protein n=1 Tax=Thermodesulfovibrio TaxID=28261 RepID=UPI00261B92ED|nr:hypothetical protein [Thermodesulfovibrio sp.]
MKRQIMSVVLAFGIVCLLFSASYAQPNSSSNPNYPSQIKKPGNNDVKINPNLKDFIQGKAHGEKIDPNKTSPDMQAQMKPPIPQKEKDDMQKVKEWSQQNLKSMSVTKTKTIPDPNNAIFVSKPRTEEQPVKKDDSIKYKLMEQDMGGKPAFQQTQNQNKQNAQVQNQTQNQQQNCVRDPKFPQLISCDPKGLKK